MKYPHIMLYDLYAGGHNGQYIEQLLLYWIQQGLQGRLTVVVPSFFVEKYPSIPALIEQHRDSGLELVRIDDDVDLSADRRFRLLYLDSLHRRMIRKYVERVRPDHSLLMSIDHVQLSLSFDLRFDFPVAISGIYFRPSFHYDSFGEARPTLKERTRKLRKTVLLKAALRNPHLHTLFSLDPYAVPFLREMTSHTQFVALPDGADFSGDELSGEEMRRRWGVESGRKVALLFGALSNRKGVFRVLEALPLLPESYQKQLCLVLSGKLEEDNRARAVDMIRRLERTTSVQIVLDDLFLAYHEIQSVIRGADLALITYQRHIGSSNVLIRAAAERKPVLGSDYGLVGEHIRRRKLGLAVDTTKAEVIAAALQTFLTDPAAYPFDAESAYRFAHENVASAYAEIIFSHLYTSAVPA